MASTHTVALLQRYAPEPEDVDIAFADVPRPVLSGDKKQLLVRVLACSLAAGDVHMISGRMTFVMRPPPNGACGRRCGGARSSFAPRTTWPPTPPYPPCLRRRAGEPPFVPGMDLVGRVEAVAPGVQGFKLGDVVVANNEAMPVGGMAEYAVRGGSSGSGGVWLGVGGLAVASVLDTRTRAQRGRRLCRPCMEFTRSEHH
jgi:threonine dehydrogenase-like Zn-dependent dehydrogenase